MIKISLIQIWLENMLSTNVIILWKLVLPFVKIQSTVGRLCVPHDLCMLKMMKNHCQHAFVANVRMMPLLTAIIAALYICHTYIACKCLYIITINANGWKLSEELDHTNNLDYVCMQILSILDLSTH